MADVNIGSDQLLTTTLTDNDRVTITTAATGQQVATMKVADLKNWAFKTLPYVGENMVANSDHGRIYDIIYNIRDEDIGKTLTFTMNVLYTGNPFTFYMFNIVDGNFVWGALNLGIQIIPDPEYKTYSLTFQISEGIRNQNRAIRISGNANFASVKWYKLEQGIFGTTWSPAPGEIARAMDYSLLYEQVVPGEFWIDADNVKKQVFVKTIRGTLPEYPLSETYIFSEVSKAFLIAGTIDGFPPSWDHETTNQRFWSYRVAGVSVWIVLRNPTTSNMKGCQYDLTFKYIKP